VADNAANGDGVPFHKRVRNDFTGLDLCGNLLLDVQLLFRLLIQDTLQDFQERIG
jgi:hypothetical protein